MEEVITARWVPHNPLIAENRARCTTVCALPGRQSHPPIPPWYTNQRHDKDTTCWQHFVSVVGFENAVAQYQVFVSGGIDVHDNFWCGHCQANKEMINVGEQLTYPDLYQFCSLGELRDNAGYLAWLHVARDRGPVVVQWITNAAKKRLAHLIGPGQAHLSHVV